MGNSLFADLMPILGTAVGGYYGGTTGALVGGDIGSSVGGAMTSQQAAQQEQDAANRALAFQQGVYTNTQNQIAPYQYAGNAALSKMMGLLGLGSLPMGNYGGYGGGAPNYSIPPSRSGGFSPSQGGSPGFGTGGGTMPGAMTPTGMGTSINAGAGQNFGYGAGDYTGSGIYGPQTIDMGGNTVTGGTGGFNWGQLAAGAGGALLAGPAGAMLGAQLAGGAGNTFQLPNGQIVQGAKNVQPTSVTIPKTTMTTPGQIIDPKTGGPIGQAYYSTPVGQLAALHQAIANGQMQSEAQNNLANTAHGLIHQKAKYGGLVGDPNMPSSVTVGEDGRETVHMMPGSMAWVEPNPGTMEKMRRGAQLPRSGGDGYPGRLLGGMVGNMGGMAGGDIGNSLALKRAAMQSAPQPIASPVSSPMAPARTTNMGLNPVQQTPGAQTTPGGPSAGFNLGTGSGASSGPVGGFVTPNLSGVGAPQTGSQSNFNPWGSNTQSQLTGGQTPSDILSQDPSYQFRFQQGLQALQNSAIARGTGLSGGYMRGAEEFGSGLASQEFGNIYSRLAALSGSGLSSTGIGSQAGASLAFPYGMASMYGGSAGAQGTLGSYGALSQGLGNLSFLYGQNSVPSYGGNTGYTPTTTTGGAGSWNSYNPNMYGSGSDWGSQWTNLGGGG